MDVEFLQTWRSWASVSFDPLHGEKSPYETLVDILSRTSSLRALRMRVAEPSGIRSAWRKFTLSHAVGIPMDTPLKPILQKRDPFSLPMLKRLELDGFQDIESLLHLSPALEILHLSLSAGFSQSANTVSRETFFSISSMSHASHCSPLLPLFDTRLYYKISNIRLIHCV